MAVGFMINLAKCDFFRVRSKNARLYGGNGLVKPCHK